MALFAAWHARVEADDTIVCLGDIGLEQSVRRPHVNAWKHAPGTKLLVMGNHDTEASAERDRLEVDAAAVLMVAAGRPPL